MSEPRSQDIAFIKHLESYVPRDPPDGERGNRAALAALRRGLGKEVGAAPEMYPYVVPWLPTATISEQGGGEHDARRAWREYAYYLVASLFGSYPSIWHGAGDEDKRSSLGASMLSLARRTELDTGSHDSIDQRFAALLNASSHDLPEHLRHAVSLLRAREVPVDWAQLLRDVQDWNIPYRPVQRSWANAYWTARAEDGDRPHDDRDDAASSDEDD